MKKIIYRWTIQNTSNKEHQKAIEEKIKDALDHEDCQACMGNRLVVEINLDAMSRNKINGSIICSCHQLLYIIHGNDDQTFFNRQNLEDNKHGHY